MNCYCCGTELTRGGDHDVETVAGQTILTNLSCPACEAYVEVYWPTPTIEDEMI